MKTFRAKFLFPVIAGALLLAGCGRGGGENANSNGANQSANTETNSKMTKDDAEEFSRIVNLPLPPEEVAWRESVVKNQKKLLAVLKFLPGDAASVAAQAERHRPPQASEVDAENWFPPELVAQSEQSGDATLKGNGYAPNDFILPPYQNGKLTRIGDTNYFVLELTD